MIEINLLIFIMLIVIIIKDSGKKIASLLVAHGANLEYQDIALRSLLSSSSSSLNPRNTLFWVIYNNSRELAYFVIQVN